jgi:transcriptional regulator with XRE-family HTH domain
VSRQKAHKLWAMPTKSQHSMVYRILPHFLRELRQKAGLTQRDIGKILKKPQSYVYNCEVANRRVDITEFAAWSKACGIKPEKSFAELLKLLG